MFMMPQQAYVFFEDATGYTMVFSGQLINYGGIPF